MTQQHPLGERHIAQVGIMVKDIEQSVEIYSRIFGMKKPEIIITDEYELAHTTYKGQPSPAKAKLAFFDMGQVQIELIEPMGDPSTWKDHLDRRGESVHHLAFIVPNTNQALAFLSEQGITVEQQGDYTGGRYTYVNSVPQLGVALELLENFDD